MLQLELLWKLQCIDREIHKIERDTKQKELQKRIIEIKNHYKVLKETLEKGFAQKEASIRMQAKCNKELEVLDYRLKESGSKLYQAGQSLKAIDNLQKEIDITRVKINEKEDELLKLMEANEKLAVDVETARKQLLQYKAEFDKLKEEYEADSEDSRTALDKFNSQREEIMKEIGDAEITQYDNISSKKINAVSQVKDGTCTECGMRLNAMLYDAVKKRNSICLCEHCGRILYLE